MSLGLKPYSAYKDSGVDWIGQVPDHWDARRFKYVLRERDARSVDGSEQLLRVSQFTGVTERKSLNGTDEPDTRAESLVGYRCVEPGELVVNIMLAWNGSMGVSSFPGIVSPAYCVYRFRSAVEPWFFHHLLRSPLYKARIKTASRGVVESRLRLYTDDLYRLEALLPPLPEQAAIVRFLDSTDRRIRHYIRAKQKLIKLLDEQKQVIIHQAVTGQIDVRTGKPYPTYRDSGVQSPRRVPEQWTSVRLKYVSTIQTGITMGKDYGTHALVEHPYLRVANVQTGKLDLSKVTTVRVPEAEVDATTLRMGDVLMTEGGDIDKLGRGCLWQNEIADCLHQNHIFAVRPRADSLLSEYLVVVLASPQGRIYFETTAKKTTNLASTNSTTLGNFLLSIPEVDEQRQLLDWIDVETSAVGAAQERARTEIDLLREFRIRLIADVVTGQLDVREVAANLPDETGEPEPHADEDLFAGDSEVDESAQEEAVLEGVEA